MPDQGCNRAFDDPTPLPDGDELRTVRDDGHFVAKLPKLCTTQGTARGDLSIDAGRAWWRDVDVLETPTERKQGWQSFSSLAVRTGSAAQQRSRFLITATMWCCTLGRRSAPRPSGRSESVCSGIVIGDLRSAAETRTIAEQVNAIGSMDAVIHNAGVYTERSRGSTPEAMPSL